MTRLTPARVYAAMLLLLSLALAGCGAATVPGSAASGGSGVKAQSDMQLIERALLACEAQEISFDSCTNLPQSTVQVTRTPTSFELHSGDLVSKYASGQQSPIPCHTHSPPTSDDNGCASW